MKRDRADDSASCERTLMFACAWLCPIILIDGV